MMRALIALTALAALIQRTATGDAWSRVAALHSQRVQQVGIVGSSLVFVANGQVTHKTAVGYQDLATKRVVDDDTIYHWASITKTFTGIAIMQLRDRGRLSLDDPAVKYVPELREIHNPYGDVAQVTVRSLMSHSSGLRAGTWPWGGDKPWHPFEPTRWAQFVAMLPYTDLRFQPGTKYSYSNPGVIILGRIIELLSGDDYEVYITKNIFMPLGMSHSFFDRAPYHLVGHRSHSYVGTDDGTTEQPFDFDSGITVSNGGLNAPLGDMARYLAFLSTTDGPVLQRSSLDEMFTPQLRAADGEGGSGDDVQAGLSSFIERHGGVELAGHSGDQNGFISHLYIHRPSRSGYIVAFNTNVTSVRDPRHTTRAVDDDVRDAIVREFWSGAR
ncbi:FmtA-like protein [Luteitalea pratensis]|uniref:FmtA-like protein n=1 Tax=Luteitalea pratensis TaxID=1855912 RepID=A0A143PH05_LUTPR|nr:serine hydrolase domain-containing protein [Luteitalea pratensis]AMY07815.1 FmtA-like protein [Luteitalea pratensis]